jgi:subtilisin family serine protease
MRRITPLTFVAAVAIGASACDSRDPNSWPVTEPATPHLSAASQEGPVTYLVIAASAASLPRNLDDLVAGNDGTVLSTIPQIGVAVVESENPDFISAMGSERGIQGVVPDYPVELPDENAGDDLQTHDPIAYAGGTDLDALLWGLDVVNAPEAWGAGVTGAGVRVAVLDAGIDHDHPDLTPNLNMALSTSFVPCIFGNCDGPVEDWKILPGFGFNHGTHTAGTIAAADDGNGVTGVAPDAEIVAVKVCTEFFNACFTSSIVSGLVYAADIDADLVNMSLGGLRFLRNDFVKYCISLGLPANLCGQFARQVVTGQDDYVHNLILIYKRAFQYAFSKGTTVLVSAGNNSADFDHTKDIWAAFADFEHVIGVSALGPVGWCTGSTNFDEQAYYTNTGRSIVDVSAPGGNFWGAFIGLTTPCTLAGITRPIFAFDGVMSTISEGWGWAQGTSMSAPHATGIAALIIQDNGGGMSPSQVERELKSRAEDLGSPGVDPLHGAGRVRSGF